METRATTFTAALLKRRWLSKKTFEITLSLPPAFEFKPGQRISLSIDQHERDYSIVSAPGESELSAADIGASFSVKGPVGYFTYKSSACPAVFVATGTGIAPFSSMARSGISGYTLLHGASLPEDLYYASLFHQSADNYIPCLSGTQKLPADIFQGTVTQYLAQKLEPKTNGPGCDMANR